MVGFGGELGCDTTGDETGLRVELYRLPTYRACQIRANLPHETVYQEWLALQAA